MRRVVVGSSRDGRSAVLADGPSPMIRRVIQGDDPDPRHISSEQLADVPVALEVGQFVSVELWSTTTAPPQLGAADRTAAEPVLPGPGMARWMISVMGPNMNWPLHRTDTLDHGIVLSGEVHLLLETGEVRLGPGDAVVIDGAVHGWRTGPSGCTKATWIIGLASAREGDR